jgi:FkbM family methyltransferase
VSRRGFDAMERILRRTKLARALTRRRRCARLLRWEPKDEERRRFYAAFVGPGDLCFDVGANLGNRTKVFLALGARVVAVEPQEECLEVLRAVYGSDSRIVLEDRALAREEGVGELLVSDAHTLTSMSPAWIGAVRQSGRFGTYGWDEVRRVGTTTLDRLIETHGIPAFVKIDVEGFEEQVVRGLSRPVRALSLEFTPEFAPSTFACIDHLASLGPLTLNYTLGESAELALEDWVGAGVLREELEKLLGDATVFGDVYVRFG